MIYSIKDDETVRRNRRSDHVSPVAAAEEDPLVDAWLRPSMEKKHSAPGSFFTITPAPERGPGLQMPSSSS